MKEDSRIFVAGHAGLVGSAVVRKLQTKGYTNLLLRTRTELDLTRQASIENFFREENPEYVILAAGKVGGILANSSFPAEFIYNNLAIATNVIHAAWENGVKRLLALGSSCIYPKHCPQPMKEAHLLSGFLEPTNEPYAIAKIAGLKICEAYNRQYGTQFIAAMPTNLYGPGDNFNLENSHVLPALMRKMHEAKISGRKTVSIWGTGTPRREFLHVDDLADACLFLMNLAEDRVREIFSNYPAPCFLNVGTGIDQTIKEVANLVRDIVGFPGDLIFDTEKPDGTPQKLLDVSRLRDLGWKPAFDLRSGLNQTYSWFLENCDQLRLA